jgi:hypothetical protein
LECYEYLFELACEMIRFGIPLVKKDEDQDEEIVPQKGTMENGQYNLEQRNGQINQQPHFIRLALTD